MRTVEYDKNIIWNAHERTRFLDWLIRSRINYPNMSHRDVVEHSLIQCFRSNRRRSVTSVITSKAYSAGSLRNLIAERNIQREKETTAILAKPMKTQDESGELCAPTETSSQPRYQTASPQAGILLPPEMAITAYEQFMEKSLLPRMEAALADFTGYLKERSEPYFKQLEKQVEETGVATQLYAEKILQKAEVSSIPVVEPEPELIIPIPIPAEKPKLRRIAVIGLGAQQAKRLNLRFKSTDLDITHYACNRNNIPAGYYECIFLDATRMDHATDNGVKKNYPPERIVAMRGGMNSFYKHIRRRMGVK